jgi:hypothetical protein
MDAGEDGRWMTYAELAEARGIDHQSARRLASRLKWQRQTDNQQIVRVYVPAARAEPGRRQRDMTADHPRDLSRAISALETAVASLTERAEAAEKRADQAEIRMEWAENRADQAEERSDRAVAQAHRAERVAEDLRSKLGDAQAELAAAQDQAEAAGTQAAAELEAAQMARSEAEADAATLRQAEAERRARGRWARIRAALRGSLDNETQQVPMRVHVATAISLLSGFALLGMAWVKKAWTTEVIIGDAGLFLFALAVQLGARKKLKQRRPEVADGPVGR